ncbi:MAG: ANTAR domain-containing protein [Clostridia bacterium]|nr:ANTAR domain-containing protein [Clostridia bacterium]
MDNVLIISSNEQSFGQFSQLLKAERCSRTDTAQSCSEGRRLIAEREYELIIINAPMKDEFGDLLALDAAQKTNSGVMLIVRHDLEQELESRVSKYGVFVIGKPLSKTIFYKALRLLEAMHHRVSGVRRENVKLQKKIDDIRIINRAKCILMEYLSMTEPQAHKYLERQAMDLRVTKIEVAKRLLSTYEN